jgi:hypothetical protein
MTTGEITPAQDLFAEIAAENDALKAERNRLDEMYSCITNMRVVGPAGHVSIHRLASGRYRVLPCPLFGGPGTEGNTEIISEHEMLLDAFDAAKKLAMMEATCG